MLEFLIFELNDTKVALPVELVASIYEAVAFHPSKTERKGVLGDFNLHGEMIPVLNLDQHFNRMPKAISLNSQIIVLNLEQTRIALIADDVKGTIKVESKEVVALNQLLPADLDLNPHSLTIYQNEIYYVLEIQSLLKMDFEDPLHA